MPLAARAHLLERRGHAEELGALLEPRAHARRLLIGPALQHAQRAAHPEPVERGVRAVQLARRVQLPGGLAPLPGRKAAAPRRAEALRRDDGQHVRARIFSFVRK